METDNDAVAANVENVDDAVIDDALNGFIFFDRALDRWASHVRILSIMWFDFQIMAL